MFDEKDQIAVNTLRALSIAQIENANSGHPGLPLGASPLLYALYAYHIRINPKESNWINRDRFVLSAGHGSALLYSMLHMSGFNLSLDDLKKFRQWGTLTPGHPEYNHTDGVDATTGPLGQGIAQAVGMAIAEQHTAALFNSADYNIIDHFTYALVGDGDLMEGISYEAISFAGRQQLEKLIVLYDSNDISLDGNLNQAFNEDIAQRFESANWHYQKVDDGNDVQAIVKAIENAKSFKGKPSIIEVKTIIGFGSPKQGTNSVHGSPLGNDNWEMTKKVYNWNYDHFEIPQVAYEVFNEKVVDRGIKVYHEWLKMFEIYKVNQPDKASQLELAFQNKLPDGFDSHLIYENNENISEATRSSSGKAIQAISKNVPYFWGGSADLSSSNKTMIENSKDFMPENRLGNNLWFGVREFGMAAIMNGIALHGGTKIFGGTFFVFTDYLKPAVRLSALSKLPVIYVMTHDSIAVGEDGPTHEPIEHLAGFRAMPNLNVFRPADVNETNAAWKIAVQSTDRPSMLVLSRQDLPVLKNSFVLADEGVDKGAYIISSSKSEVPEGILIASGSEVSLAIKVQKRLREHDIDVSVVSMPSMNRFDEQNKEYKESILPEAVVNRASIEMAATFGWERYVGISGLTIGIDKFGASAPSDKIINEYGFSVEEITNQYLSFFYSR